MSHTAGLHEAEEQSEETQQSCPLPGQAKGLHVGVAVARRTMGKPLYKIGKQRKVNDSIPKQRRMCAVCVAMLLVAQPVYESAVVRGSSK